MLRNAFLWFAIFLFGACSLTNQVRPPLRATLDRDFADPSVLKNNDGYYYAYATQTAAPTPGAPTVNIQVARSRNLHQWEFLGDALPDKPLWAKGTQDFWAPHVIKDGTTFYMYYSSARTHQKGLCLAVAVADHPQGPFRDKGAPLRCHDGFTDIDPMAFDDAVTGEKLLYWGSGFGPIYVQALKADRLGFAENSQPQAVLYPIADPSLDTKGYERLIEGAWVVAHRGEYFLFYSGSNCCGPSASYAVMVAKSKNPRGPFEKMGVARRQADSVVLEKHGSLLAPGHIAITSGPRDQYSIWYHGLDGNHPHDPRRRLYVEKIEFKEGWPQVRR